MRTTMSDHTHQEQAHAILGASAAYRWMACPGSVRLSKEVGFEDTSSPYAREGTAAHAVAEKCLSSGLDPEFYVGQRIEGIEVTREMASAVRVYVDRVRMVAEAAQTDPLVEVRFDLSTGGPDGKGLDPPEPMFGTADAVVWDELHGKHLWIMDYKHGQGIAVEAENNPQLQYYALGAVLALGVKPRKVTVVIVQPRATHRDGIIRDWTFEWEDLVAFKERLMVAAYETEKEDAPLAVGPWCKFCPAKAQCPAQYDHAVETAQQEFAVIEAPDESLDTTGSLPAPHLLTENELLEVLDKADYVMDWLRSVQKYADEKLESGAELPGWKLVAKRANRKWNNEEDVVSYLKAVPGLEPDDYLPRKLLSPRQVELLLKRIGADMPGDLTNRDVTGYNRVPADDPREAIAPPGSEFAANEPARD
jgi:hypothetical protein